MDQKGLNIYEKGRLGGDPPPLNVQKSATKYLKGSLTLYPYHPLAGQHL